MSRQDHTCAKLEVARVKRAAQRCIDYIKTERARMLEERIAYYVEKRRGRLLYRWGWLGEMSRKTATVLVEDGGWFKDHRWYAWGALDTAERILRLANATHALEMSVSSEDFELSLDGYYDAA